MDKELIRVLCIFSATIGALIGILPLFPFLTGLAFTLLMFFIAPIVLIYFSKLKLIKEFEVEKCLTVGAISGAVACLGFSIVYLPLALILQLIFKIQSFIWIKVLFTNFGFFIPMIVLIALVCALFNAFSAFLVAYFYSYFKQNKQ